MHEMVIENGSLTFIGRRVGGGNRAIDGEAAENDGCQFNSEWIATDLRRNDFVKNKFVAFRHLSLSSRRNLVDKSKLVWELIKEHRQSDEHRQGPSTHTIERIAADE